LNPLGRRLLISTHSRFFYGDQRTPKGGPVGSVTDAEAHADMYSKLATGDTDVPWHVSFVAGKGYVDFSS
jgi:hypothetical protein